MDGFQVKCPWRVEGMVWTNSCSTGEYLQTLESVPTWKFFDTKDTFQGVP